MIETEVSAGVDDLRAPEISPVEHFDVKVFHGIQAFENGNAPVLYDPVENRYSNLAVFLHYPIDCDFSQVSPKQNIRNARSAGLNMDGARALETRGLHLSQPCPPTVVIR